MALADSLPGLLRLPGATYACVVERDSGRVLTEAGRGEGSASDGEGVVPYSVAGWGTAVAAMFDTTSGDELDDVMITGRRSYHLLRALGPGASVLAYLRLDRARSNLAAARRELAAVRWGADTGPRGAGSPGAEERGPASPADVRPSGARGPAAEPPGPRGGPTSAPARPAAVTRVPAALPPSGSLAKAGAPGAAASAPPSGSPSASPSGSPVRGRGAVAVRDDTGPARPATAPRIPLPRRAPGHRTPGSSRRGAAPRTSVPVPGPADASEVPEGFAMPAVLGQSWARDPGTLRRLIAGLRKLS